LIITAPFCSLTHFAPYHYTSGFNKYWYEIHLTQSGFKDIAISRNGNFFEYLSQEIHRIPSVSNRYSEDKPSLLESFSVFILQRMLLRFSKNAYSEICHPKNSLWMPAAVYQCRYLCRCDSENGVTGTILYTPAELP